MKHLIKLSTLLSLTGLLLIMNNSCEPECETCQEPPQASDQTFSVAEESPGGTSVGFIKAESTSGTLSYHMVSDIAAHYFVVNETTGEITVRDSALLDYETQQSYTFDAVVTDTKDDGFSVTLTITINITDVDELKKGLVAYYPFNGNANDETGNGYDGVLKNAPTLTEDRFGNSNSAYEFDGVDDYIELNENNSIITFKTYTISAWAKMEGEGGGIDNINTLFQQRDDSYNSHIVFHTENNYKNAKLIMRGNGSTDTSSVQTPSRDYFGWHHYVGVVDEDNNMKLYCDGQLVATSVNECDTLNYSVIDYVDIGRHRYGGMDRAFFNGLIDEMRIYNRALSLSEIQSLYTENGWTGDTSNVNLKNGLVAHYPFNGNANDESGNGYDGTVNGAVLDEDRFGNAGSAYLFDGLDDYIVIGDHDAFEPDAFSISLWCKRNGNSSVNMVGSLFTKYQSYFNNREYTLNWGNNDLSERFRDKIFFVTSWTRSSPVYKRDSAISESITHNDWVHVTAVKTEQTISLYINGEKVSEEATPGPSTKSGSNVYIGAIHKSTTTPDNNFNGTIDDVRFYNRPLHEDEINALYTENGWGK
jgi:hypothetical protein